MRTRITLALLGGLCLLVLAGCIAKVPVQSAFWQDKQSRIGVAFVKYPMVAAHKVGAQGLLDMAINNAVAGSLEAHLRTIDVTGFSAAADQFVQKLQERGLTAKKIAEPIDINALEKFQSPGSGDYMNKDLRSLAKTEEIDYLILLSIERVGTIRKYYGFIALGSPAGFCQARGRMVDLRTNELKWSAIQPEKEATLKVAGQWKQPPDYLNVTATVKQAVQNGATFLVTQFFK